MISTKAVTLLKSQKTLGEYSCLAWNPSGGAIAAGNAQGAILVSKKINAEEEFEE